MLVTQRKQFTEICAQLRSAGSFALDTEFVRERTFYIRLGIVQVATDDVIAVFDPAELGEMTDLYELVADPNVEKIVHAGEQDFAVLFERAETVPQNVFDTQVAAALVGYGDQISYAKLVAKVTGVQLSKLETLTDWTSRPLTEAQIEYSLEDVRYLSAIRAHLVEKLSSLGRLGWEREEGRRLEQADTYRALDPRDYYKKLKTNGLSSEKLGVLREVVAFRERTAREMDIPRGWVMKDQSLLELARRRPASMKALAQIRSITPKQVDRFGAHLLEAVKLGIAEPVLEPVVKNSSLRVSPAAESQARLLEAWLYARSADAEIAPSMLGTREQLKLLAAAHESGRNVELPVLSGWRRNLVGQDLLDILDGKVALAIDRNTGTITTRTTAPKPE